MTTRPVTVQATEPPVYTETWYGWVASQKVVMDYCPRLAVVRALTLDKAQEKLKRRVWFEPLSRMKSLPY